LLARRPPVPTPPPAPDAGIVEPVALDRAMDPAVAKALLAGAGDGEHRSAAVAFIEFRGVAELAAGRGTAGVVDAIDRLMTVCQDAAARFHVTFHETDIGPDGGKILLVAGVPTALDAPEEAMLCTVRETIERAGEQLRIRAGVRSLHAWHGDLQPRYAKNFGSVADGAWLFFASRTKMPAQLQCTNMPHTPTGPTGMHSGRGAVTCGIRRRVLVMSGLGKCAVPAPY
jgi:class 3 adenylate cyclase